MGKEAAGDAAHQQAIAASRGQDISMEMFRQFQQTLQPYVGAGNTALNAQMSLLGLGPSGAMGAPSGPGMVGPMPPGMTSQADAIAGLQAGPEFQALMKQGEDAILQNASATGGLRGGNTQAALAQFRPALLAGLMNQRFNQLGALTGMGANAAAGVGNAGMQTGQNVANLYGQQGAAVAGGILGGANAQIGAMNNMQDRLFQTIGMMSGKGGGF